MKFSNSELRTIVSELGSNKAGVKRIVEALKKKSRQMGGHLPAKVVRQNFSYNQIFIDQTESHGKEQPTLLRWEIDIAAHVQQLPPPSIDFAWSGENDGRIIFWIQRSLFAVFKMVAIRLYLSFLATCNSIYFIYRSQQWRKETTCVK